MSFGGLLTYIKSKYKEGVKKEDIKVDSCSSCNPFFTGAQRSIGADSRADKFKKKYKSEFARCSRKYFYIFSYWMLSFAALSPILLGNYFYCTIYIN